MRNARTNHLKRSTEFFYEIESTNSIEFKMHVNEKSLTWYISYNNDDIEYQNKNKPAW